MSDEFREALLAVEVNEASRNELLQRIVSRLDSLSRDHNKLLTRLSQAEYLNEKYFEDLEQHKRDIGDMKKLSGRSPFVLVLIDGDITLFDDRYIHRGADGGHDAAKELHRRVVAYLEACDSIDYSSQCSVIIKIYSRITTGLSQLYADSGILAHPNMFRNFVDGFNQERVLSEYIEAGTDKEGADSKVKANLDMYFHNQHCKHLLLAVSGDKSYAGFLRQYRPTNHVHHRITLIKALPFPKAMHSLAHQFLVTDLTGFFRDEKIVVRRTIERNERTVSSEEASDNQSIIVTGSESGTPSSRNIGHNRINSSDGSSASLVIPSISRILRNKDGQRLDAPVQYDKAIFKVLQPQKLCNRHFLTVCTAANCCYKHRGELNIAEKTTLKYIARLAPCKSSVHCNDLNCVAGHRCVYMQGAGCRYQPHCRFDNAMHYMDVEVHDAEVS